MTQPVFLDADYCQMCGQYGCDCDCDVDGEACEVCGGSGHLYDDEDPLVTWSCAACDGDGFAR